ncbi:hypothetical protein EYF80_002413 [Liparis tanakae]|uniref:Uncharacterized protein n=1 Tax=Liparis tanakae TaxID=230148 RepID=A0A4Z2JB50_9TELE|nr:hypothetical protein EYF80_002413 [Liparis tanakae]
MALGLGPPEDPAGALTWTTPQRDVESPSDLGSCSGQPGTRGAGQPQGAVAVRPVLSAAGFPLQPGTLVAASAGIPGQCPASLAAVRRVAGTSAEITWRALVSRERAHQDKDM